MKEKVVFILGAGFSAPLGLPVMSNFLSKSKDMYFSDPERYSYFKDVFDTINRLSVIKNYFSSDLFNIEEILSILAMESFLDNSELDDNFKKYIVDVIQYFTPKIPAPSCGASNWEQVMYRDKTFQKYCYFIFALLNLELRKRRDEGKLIVKAHSMPSNLKYSFITLNYDRIPELIIEHLKENFECSEINDLPILKLHGCVARDNIVPPTWNKGNQSGIEEQWKLAFQEVKNANHIIIAGYSLPESDSYIKYLLKSAIVESEHLKSIDVICYEKCDSVKKRYESFITFSNFRFINSDICELLSKVQPKKTTSNPRNEDIRFTLVNNNFDTFRNKIFVN